MSKKVKALLVTLLVAMVMGFTSCGLVGNKYEVYTASVDAYALAGAPEPGAYSKGEITESYFKRLASASDVTKHSWTEEKVYNWFIDEEFDNELATQETEWLLSCDHAMIFSRNGSKVHILFK